MICFIKIRSEKNKMIWNIIYILYDLKFFQMWSLYSFVSNISLRQYGINFIASPLQPRYFDTKTISAKITNLMKSGFL